MKVHGERWPCIAATRRACGDEAYWRRKLGEEIKHDYIEEVRQGQHYVRRELYKVRFDAGGSVDKCVSTVQNLPDEYNLGSNEADDKIRVREQVLYLLNGVPEGSMLKPEGQGWESEILDETSTHSGHKRYLVCWIGWDEKYDEWLPPSRINQGMIDNWNANR
jgi:hypothetical protein